MKPYQRHNRLRASLAYFIRLGYKILIQRSKPDRQMTFPDGGLTVALVGVDGAGKSTISAALTDWLRWKIDTPFHYLGSKQPSPWTKWSYLFFRMARRGHRELSAVMGQDIFLARWMAGLRQNLLALHYIFVGLDRFRRYRRAQNEIASGSIVVFDRYPFAAPLDGPEIQLIDKGYLNPVSRLLSRLENDLYRKFESLNLLILMEVSPETSLRRKPDHPLETIKAKNIALQAVKDRITQEPEKWNWASVDAEKPLEDVLLQVKRSVWVALGS
jgi:thymidylate kinase